MLTTSYNFVRFSLNKDSLNKEESGVYKFVKLFRVKKILNENLYFIIEIVGTSDVQPQSKCGYNLRLQIIGNIFYFKPIVYW